MPRFLLPCLILGACAVCVATICLADPPEPAPQRAGGRKAPAATISQPVAVSKPVTTATTRAGATHGIIFVGGKSAINSQPVPPGRPARPIGPGTGDPLAAKFARPAAAH